MLRIFIVFALIVSREPSFASFTTSWKSSATLLSSLRLDFLFLNSKLAKALSIFANRVLSNWAILVPSLSLEALSIFTPNWFLSLVRFLILALDRFGSLSCSLILFIFSISVLTAFVIIATPFLS